MIRPSFSARDEDPRIQFITQFPVFVGGQRKGIDDFTSRGLSDLFHTVQHAGGRIHGDAAFFSDHPRPDLERSHGVVLVDVRERLRGETEPE